MKYLSQINSLDIYLLDQIMKDRISPEHKILDAGCGSGRNLRYFLNEGFDITGLDPDRVRIQSLKDEFSDKSKAFIPGSIEEFNSPILFDYIICNAVLHFARDHKHFVDMFEGLNRNLRSGGTLFIRTCSDIGIEHLLKDGLSGVYDLPDGSTRYLINRDKINEMLKIGPYESIEPPKTVNVDDLRAMTTLVLQKE